MVDGLAAMGSALGSQEVARPWDGRTLSMDFSGQFGGMSFGEDPGSALGIGGQLDLFYRLGTDRWPLRPFAEGGVDGFLAIPGFEAALGAERPSEEECNCTFRETIETGRTIGARIGAGLDLGGVLALGYDLHYRDYDARMPNGTEYGDPEGGGVFQDGLSASLYYHNKREGTMGVTVRSTGRLLLPERRIGEPALSFVSYGADVSWNLFAVRVAYEMFEFSSGEGRPIVGGNAYRATLGIRLQPGMDL